MKKQYKRGVEKGDSTTPVPVSPISPRGSLWDQDTASRTFLLPHHPLFYYGIFCLSVCFGESLFHSTWTVSVPRWEMTPPLLPGKLSPIPSARFRAQALKLGDLVPVQVLPLKPFSYLSVLRTCHALCYLWGWGKFLNFFGCEFHFFH